MAPAVAVASSTVPYNPPVVMLEAWMLYGSCCGCGLQYSTVQASSSDIGGLDVVWLLLWLWPPVLYRPPVVILEAWMLYGSCCGCGLQYSTVQASSCDVGDLDVVWLLLLLLLQFSTIQASSRDVGGQDVVWLLL